MSNKEMLHRKQYRIAAVVAGLALAVSMTACGAQKGTEGTDVDYRITCNNGNQRTLINP